jgi:ABC-2 type transport system permease protein
VSVTATGRGPRRAAVLAAFVRKEVHHILRDRITLAIILVLPLVQVLLFGSAIRTEVEHVRLAIVDPSPDEATLAVRARLRATPLFETVAVLPTVDALPPLFERGAARLAVVFGPGFAERLGRGEPARVLVVTDATDPNTGSAMQGYALSVLQRYEADLRAERGGGAAGVRIVPEVRMRFNPTLRSANLFVPGLIAFVLTLVSALMTAVSLVREKERGTMEVLLVSPLRPWQIVAGKVLPYLALGFVGAASTLVAARVAFGVPVRGSVALLLGETAIFLVAALSLGILISGRTSSQRVATMAALAGLMMPTMLLSGFVFPVESLPGWLRPVTNVLPAKWFVLVTRGIMLKGAGLAELWQETLVLAGMAALLLTAGIHSAKARLE